MTPTTRTHLVANCIQAWGHARPLVTFCAHLVKMQTDLCVTLLSTGILFDRLTKEAARNFGDGDESPQRLRIVCMGAATDLIGDGLIEPMWKALIAGESLECQQTGTTYDPLPAPTVVILDFFAIKNTRIVRSLSGSSVKIYSWWSGLAYSILYQFGDAHVGGLGNIRVRAEEESRKSGRPYHEVATEMFYTKYGGVVRLPGLPPMYDYDNYPQDFEFGGDTLIEFLPQVNEHIAMTDGALLTSFESWEKDSIQVARNWLAETGRPVYTTGPLLPPASKTSVANEKIQSPEGAEIEAFLGEMLSRSGEHSLLYISFGSIFFPVKTPEKLWAFLEVVVELNIPFIMSAASPFCVVPDEVRVKVKSYGKGLISTWTPQQMILDHPVTGWYLSHGGQNGVTEAIASCVPLIMWPFTADQPMNAVLVTDVHKVGYELLEVRSGSGLQKIFRTGYTPVGTIDAVKAEARDVLGKAFGKDGEDKRARMRVLQQALLSEWEEDGTSKRDVSAFLESF
ncbi:UDP-Glycosyltransferase/glycogen phosphorylase [Epithele typhae]|uniref:UDP-Glycosyltransferase/glycogen phosphorylase n=1 Tax=Epithele typhae TaxID=378194 RepID=UPI002008AD5B|nr:UDP-Glycosyltransferase/glycogen phosphorylase [Epithele typhae]KAH9925915.1 UDP-Glycosyltransferase/glycogen phosphorylase [Epithele typhae]